MNILYQEEYEQVEVYCFQINQGGNLQIKLEGYSHQQEVKLIFVNGKFERSDLPFSPPFNRSHWHVLGAIAQKIAEIEAKPSVELIELVDPLVIWK